MAETEVIERLAMYLYARFSVGEKHWEQLTMEQRDRWRRSAAQVDAHLRDLRLHLSPEATPDTK